MTPSSSRHTFSCHRCRQPLVLSASLSDDVGGALTQSAYDVVEAEYAQAAQNPGAQNAGSSLSSQLALTTSLFDLLSSTAPPEEWVPPTKPVATTNELRRANHGERKKAARLPIGAKGKLLAAIDHPLCAECTNVLLSLMDAQLDELRRERDAYTAFDESIRRRQDLPTSTQADVETLLAEAEAAKIELLEAQRDAIAVQEDLRALEAEEKALEEQERHFWAEYSAMSLESARLSDQRSSLQASLDHDKAQLNRLELSNVYDDAFSIGYEGGYGTINGLRLGRLPQDRIDWPEINAAWGQTAFLLVTLARKLDITFESYAVHPIGSFSTIEKLGERREVYELHGSNEWQIGRLLTDRRFDHAMVAFLDCLRQLCAVVTTRDAGVKLPHAISRDKIGGASIRLQFGSDEIWTRALRNVLMTLKILLAWSIKDDNVPNLVN